ncbi:VCBS repeat-containing protein [Nonlabens xiamenensis]|uniref:VCBS repeat-containing protein n=1 Tax=Nonlabens xiamenensis TaxID=2341043 RepID=UPI001F0B757C|nr:VCBS repeat-containing protein [Nonlabens xiamenensis]
MIFSCQEKTQHDDAISTTSPSTSFTEVEPESSGVDFSNILTETDAINYFDYPSIYMGGGVAVGDINNDGWDDLFFTGNQVKNGLYLNKGKMVFENISAESGIEGDDRWYVGATMVDINADGLLDIYCSVGGIQENRRNQLFINNGDTTFTEQAAQYGLDNNSTCTQAVFFDYDNDGDLDLYQAVYPLSHTNATMLQFYTRIKQDEIENSNRLYRNDGNSFIDVTREAGVNDYSFTLGVSAADINNDGWTDLYVSNDYATPDAYYYNNGDGTFTNKATEAFKHTSYYGMGVDIADVNNDGQLDIFQVDMDSNNNRRQKANMASMNPRIFRELALFDFQRQHMHNSFQINSGYEINGVPQFSNVSRLTGTSSTDWSWGPLLADLDNDGLKDLFVTNGTRREVNNKDYFRDHSNWDWDKTTKVEAVKKIPSERIDNFVFKNQGDLDFKQVNDQWNLKYKGFSTGSAYADLDNDGDLEIITCNVDDPISIFRNDTPANKSLTISFKGSESNPFGIGARVILKNQNQTQLQELTTTRGFQSSVAPKLHFGLGEENRVENLEVFWPDGSYQQLEDIKAGEMLVLDYALASKKIDNQKDLNKSSQLFASSLAEMPRIKAEENQYDDYQEQILLPHKMSQFGPAMAIADLNQDGVDDFYLGGAYNKNGRLFISEKSGEWNEITITTNKDDRLSEDVDAIFIDIDADGDQDLYVVSGGNEFIKTSKYYQDRLYLNDGNNNFAKYTDLPTMQISGGKVVPYDYDKNGKMDLVVLGRHVPWNYPAPAQSVILKNLSQPGQVRLNIVTDQVAPAFNELGMATDALVTDVDQDGWEDLIVVGEWMPIKIFNNQKGTLKDVSQDWGLNEDTTGWWWSINGGDFDGDGDTDYILGNNGLNYKYKASADATFDIYANDFDGNQRTDIVLSYHSEGKQFPVRGRECSSQQIPGIKKKFENYETFSEATLSDVYSEEALENSLHYQVKSFASIYLENKEGKMIIHQLPRLAQLSNITGIQTEDFNQDGHLDVLIAGNLYVSEVETPRNDAGYGLLMLGDGKGSFQPVPASESGVYIPGDVKRLKRMSTKNGEYIVAVKNDDYLQFVKIRS